MGADVEHQSAAAGARVSPVEGWRRRQGLREEAELVSFTRLAKPAELAIHQSLKRRPEGRLFCS